MKPAPAVARSELADAGVISGERFDDALLLVSELVSNAVRHGTFGIGSIRMRVGVAPGLLRVEVEDGGTGFSPPANPMLESGRPGGLGLRLLQSLADRWGIDGPPRTVVWFELESA